MTTEERARLVREALLAIAQEFGGGYARDLARNASDATLARLGRLLR
jgi:hypothetical protein